ncbi:hypothetical protein ACWIFB_07980 [Dietzia sp. NPDC055340]
MTTSPLDPVLAAVADHPGITAAEVAERTGFRVETAGKMLYQYTCTSHIVERDGGYLPTTKLLDQAEKVAIARDWWTTTAVTPITGYVNTFQTSGNRYHSEPCPAILMQTNGLGETRVVAAVMLPHGELRPAEDVKGYQGTDPIQAGAAA